MSQTAVETLTPLVFINGTELSAAHREFLSEIRVDLQLRLPGRVTLRFQDPQHELAKSTWANIGDVVVVRVPRVTDPLIEAEITGFAFEAAAGASLTRRLDGRRGRVSEFVITGYDRSHRLARSLTIAGEQMVSASDLVARMAAGIGCTSTADSCAPFPYLTRALNDLELINALADHEGFDWWVAGRDLKFQRPATSNGPTLELGTESLTSVSVEGSGLYPDSVKVSSWDSKATAPIIGVAQTGASEHWPDITGEGRFSSVKNAHAKLGTAQLYSAKVASASQDESKRIAESLRDRLVAAAITARGEGSGNAGMRLGATVTIAGTGAVDGSYRLTAVEHIARPTSFVTRFVAGARTPTSLADTLATATAPAQLPLQHAGLVIGIVTALGNPNDETKGTVRVKFPVVNDVMESAWGRFIVPGGGGDNARGLVLLPEVGDEVLVGFEDGDVHRPVVIGGLYGDGKGGSWDVAGSKVAKRRLVSRDGTTVEILEDDKPENRHCKILVKGKSGDVVLRLAGDTVELTGAGTTTIKVSNDGGSIAIDGDGSISLSGPKINLKATEQLTLDAPKVTVKADDELQLTSSAKAELKGLQVAVTATMEASVKGMPVKLN